MFALIRDCHYHVWLLPFFLFLIKKKKLRSVFACNKWVYVFGGRLVRERSVTRLSTRGPSGECDRKVADLCTARRSRELLVIVGTEVTASLTGATVSFQA